MVMVGVVMRVWQAIWWCDCGGSYGVSGMVFMMTVVGVVVVWC